MTSSETEDGLAALALSPHPDDVEMCCGGLLALLASRGHRVGVLDLTRGELASNGTPETRAEEARAAAEVLGLTLRENLGLPDGFIDASGGARDAASAAESQLGRLVEAIRRLRPELVLAPHAHARHPDHVAASALATRAVFFAGLARFETAPARPRHVVRKLVHYGMRGAFEPSFVTDVSAVYPLKQRAVACYGSQVRRGAADQPTLANARLGEAAWEARDRYYGAMIGVAHGEPFRVHGALALADPVAHFREGSDALFFPEPA
ncbi:MAG: bacillithiol biosynthesis deacetylase BshB1 [Deltaproteobacteria bacterium]|nr:bacillithiol biosynthesis deacetylase BshB1 [Deltaproteobacteria bacterium]MCB9786695.1 bacillithiol biosynthesis deacetylase BshB1 [Deltaproteobacteria bacterium]